jgi:aminoglycoside N3'-acetyltransferase
MSKPIHVKPLFYANCYEGLKAIALKYGYNLVVHGSLNRDFDLIAIPWAEVIGDYMEMLNEFVDNLGGHIMPEHEAQVKAFADKYHGRIVKVINLNRGGKATNYEDPQWYLDISIIPFHKKDS